MIKVKEFYDYIKKYMRPIYTQGYRVEQERLRTNAIQKLRTALATQYPDIKDLEFDDDWGANFSRIGIYIKNIPLLTLDTNSYNIERGYYVKIMWSYEIENLDIDLETCTLDDLIAQAIDQKNKKIIKNSKEKINNYINNIEEEIKEMNNVGMDTRELTEIIYVLKERIKE